MVEGSDSTLTTLGCENALTFQKKMQVKKARWNNNFFSNVQQRDDYCNPIDHSFRSVLIPSAPVSPPWARGFVSSAYPHEKSVNRLRTSKSPCTRRRLQRDCNNTQFIIFVPGLSKLASKTVLWVMRQQGIVQTIYNAAPVKKGVGGAKEH